LLTCYILHSRVRLHGFFSHGRDFKKCLVINGPGAAPLQLKCDFCSTERVTMFKGMGYNYYIKQWDGANTITYRYKSSPCNKNLIPGCHAMLNLNNHITFRFRKTCRAHLTIIQLICILHKTTLIIELLYNYTIYIQKIIVLFLFQIGT